MKISSNIHYVTAPNASKLMHLEKYSPDSWLKTFTLKKARNSGLDKDAVLRDLTNLVVTRLDHSFNATFDVHVILICIF